MHQLTKDPGYYRGTFKNTESSPERTLTLAEIVRCLDYCAELLSIISKFAALHAQEINNCMVLAAVSEVESLVAGLRQKIWQKLDIPGKIRLIKWHPTASVAFPNRHRITKLPHLT